MKVSYYQDTDSLYIELVAKPGASDTIPFERIGGARR
jgi:uncharacterized protein YuzE